MKRSQRYLAILLTLAILQPILLLTTVQPAMANLLDDYLSVVPDWADLTGGRYNPAMPPDPLAGLLPRNPLAGVGPNIASPGAPQALAPSGPAMPEQKAPADIQLPTPPPAPNCQCGPDTISVSTGNLSMAHTDLTLPGVGSDLSLTRNYDSASAEKEGPFGYGWDFLLNNRLQMYVHYHITEHRGDGSLTTFEFVDGTNGAFVESFDGDSHIHTNLAQSSYSPNGAHGWSLVRESQHRYVVTRADGTVYAYYGYHAPWRSNEDHKAGRLISITDRNGNSLSLDYDGQGRIQSIQDDLGRRLIFTWSGNRITSISDHAGRTVSYRYESGRLVEVSGADQPTLSYSYGSSHRLTGQAGGPAGQITYQYDGEGRVAQAGDATYTYTASRTTYTDPGGAVWHYDLDDKKRVVRLTDPLGTETVTTYNSEGRTQQVTAPGLVTAYTYDVQGRPLTITRNGQTTTYGYGAFGLTTKVQTPAGVTLYQYDARGNLTSRIEPGLDVVTYTHDSRGRVVTEMVGTHTTRYFYDQSGPSGRPTRIEDALGKTERRTLNALGLPTAVQSPDGWITTYSYDQAGRLTVSVNPGGGVTSVTYDAGGRMRTVSAPGGSKATYTYNARGWATAISYQDGPSYSYAYDGMGRILSVADALTGIILLSSTYDTLGRLTATADSRGVTTSFAYEHGEIAQVDGPSGVVSYQRDAQGRVTDVVGPGTRHVELGYDQAGRVNQVKAGSQTISAVLNAQGQPLTITGPQGSIQFTYDGRGKVTSVTYPDGQSMAYQYDGLARVVKVTPSSGLIAEYHYDGAYVTQTDSMGGSQETRLGWHGRPEWVKDAIGAELVYAYDETGRLTASTNGEGETTAYEYDHFGRLVKVTDPLTRSTTYEYDRFNRLTQVTDRMGRSTTYSYDLEANTVTRQAPGVKAATFWFDRANRLVDTTDSGGIRTERVYNPEGLLESLTRSGTAQRTGKNITGTWTWTYNQDGQVTQTADPLQRKTQYFYDGQGQLSYMLDPMNHRTDYTYDSVGRVTEVQQPNGGRTRYVYDEIGRLLSVTDAANATWQYGYNPAGRVVQVTDPLGAITAYEYDAVHRLAEIWEYLDEEQAAVTVYSYDMAGRVSSITDPNGTVRTLSYDAGGRLVDLKNPLNHTYEYRYDFEGQLTAVIDPLGRTTRYMYDQGGRLSQLIAPDQAVTAYTYDNGGRLASVSLDGAITKYYYDGLGRIEAVQNAHTAITAFEYDVVGNLLTVTDPLQQVSTFEYDALGRVVKETDRRNLQTLYQYDVINGISTVQNKAGHIYQYHFDRAGRLVKAVDPDQRAITYGYDLLGRLTQITEPLGSTQSFVYDTFGRVVELREREGAAARAAAERLSLPEDYIIYPERVQTYAYDLVGNLLSMTGSAGLTISYGYDALGRQTSAHWRNPDGTESTEFWTYLADNQLATHTSAVGGVTTYRYDQSGRVASITDANGHATSLSYNQRGLITAVTDPDGKSTYQYDLVGNLISYTDPRGEGHTTRYEYDILQRLVKVTDPLGGAQQFRYDAEGNLTGHRDEREQWWSFENDALGRAVVMVDPLGRKSEWGYSASGRVQQVTDAMGGISRFTYDELDRLVEQNLPGAVKAAFAYDWRSNLIAEQNDNGHLTFYAFDQADRLVQVTDAMGGRTRYAWDQRGYLTGITDANGHTTSFARDPLGRLLSQTTPENETTYYAYDPLGNLVEKVDPLGQVTSYAYNHRGQVTTIDYDGVDKSFFAYDPVGNLVEAGNNTVLERYSYDALDRLISQTNVTLEKTTHFRYDASSNRTAVIDPEGRVTQYAYDAAGWLEQVTLPDDATTRFDRDPLNRLTQIVRPNDVVTTYSYNDAGYISELVHRGPRGLIESYTYRYDGNGNKLEQIESDGARTSWAYDSLDRLVKATYPKEKIQRVRDTNFFAPKLLRPTKDGEAGDEIDPEEWGAVSYRQAPIPWSSGNSGNQGGGGNSGNQGGGGNSGNQGGGGNSGNQGGSGNAGNQGGGGNSGNQGGGNSGNQGGGNSGNQGGGNSGNQGGGNSGNQGGGNSGNQGGGNSGNQGGGNSGNQGGGNSGNQGGGNSGNQGGGNSGNQGGGNSGNQGGGGNSGNQGNGKPDNPGQGKGQGQGQGNNNAGGNGKGQGNGAQGLGQCKPRGVAAVLDRIPPGLQKENSDSGVKTYTETPGYLMEPTAEVTYVYDKGGNRLSMTTDQGTTTYSYDKANRMLTAGDSYYLYDEAGKLVAKVTGEEVLIYEYNAAGQLVQVIHDDESFVRYAYDALGRKAQRIEASWVPLGNPHGEPPGQADKDLPPGQAKDHTPPGLAKGHTPPGQAKDHTPPGQAKDQTPPGQAKDHTPPGQAKDHTPPGLADDKGQGNNSARNVPGNQGNGKGPVKDDPCAEEDDLSAAAVSAGHDNGNGKSQGLALGHQNGAGNEQATAHQKLRLQVETTSYLYNGLGLNVLKEYRGATAPKAEYYYANGQVLARKMFGLGNSIIPDREPGLANGGTYYYLTDALGSVTALTDHRGIVAREYRYDAFGGLFAGTLGVYNSVGLTGKSYDAKAGLMDYSARWYDPKTGRFTQADSFFGWLDWPASLHKYTYVHNNPLRWIDPTGRHIQNDYDRMTCEEAYGKAYCDNLHDHDVYAYSPWNLHDRSPGPNSGDLVVDNDTGTALRVWTTYSTWERTRWTVDVHGHHRDPVFESVTLTYQVEVRYQRIDGVWVEIGSPIVSGDLRPPGASEPDDTPPPPTPEQIRQESNRMLEAITGQAPVTIDERLRMAGFNDWAINSEAYNKDNHLLHLLVAGYDQESLDIQVQALNLAARNIADGTVSVPTPPKSFDDWWYQQQVNMKVTAVVGTMAASTAAVAVDTVAPPASRADKGASSLLYHPLTWIIGALGSSVVAGSTTTTTIVDQTKEKPVRYYRYVGEGEAAVIRATGVIPNVDRDGNPKLVYFTTEYTNSSTVAQQRLALPSTPTYRVEFESEQPIGTYLGLAEPLYGQPGGAPEYITVKPIPVDVTRLTPLE